MSSSSAIMDTRRESPHTLVRVFHPVVVTPSPGARVPNDPFYGHSMVRIIHVAIFWVVLEEESASITKTLDTIDTSALQNGTRADRLVGSRGTWRVVSVMGSHTVYYEPHTHTHTHTHTHVCVCERERDRQTDRKTVSTPIRSLLYY